MIVGQGIRIVIADDQKLSRDSLRQMLESDPELTVVAEASGPSRALDLVRLHKPDILLLDLLMPNGGGLAALRELARDPVPATRVIILTAAIDRGKQMIAVQLGARGMMTKESTTELLLKCIRCVQAGKYWLDHETVSDLVNAFVLRPSDNAPSRVRLTSRELDIVAAVVYGASNREIAEHFGISPQTVKNHLSSAFDKAGVSNRVELAHYAVKHRILANRPGLC